MFILSTSTVLADTVSLNYYPKYSINGDAEELDDLTPGDDYTYLSLGESRAFSLKYSSKDQSKNTNTSDTIHFYNWYIDYTTFNLNRYNENSGKYQSITAGLSSLTELYYSNYIRTFYSFGFGIGGSRFVLSDDKYRGAAETSLEAGVVLWKILFLSVGGKYQIIGEPTETMAKASGFSLGVSVKY